MNVTKIYACSWIERIFKVRKFKRDFPKCKIIAKGKRKIGAMRYHFAVIITWI